LTISNNNLKKKEVINISDELNKNKLKRNHSKSRNNNKESIMKLNTTFKKGLLSEFFKTNINNNKKENKNIINYNNDKKKINQHQKINNNLINKLTNELILKNKYNVSKEQSKLFKKKIIKLRNNKTSILYFNDNNINKNNKFSFEIEKLINKNPHFTHSKSNIKNFGNKNK
jgi:hypothetical protein